VAATSALTIADTARLLRLRGEAMQKAVPVGMGAMAALLGLDYETGVSVAQEACAVSGDHEICAIANDNGGGQVVASGTKKAVDQAIEIAKGKGARRAMLLSVSALPLCPDAACCGSDGRSPGTVHDRQAPACAAAR
jgi:[acyl-carrier-protein] S-malonyltransferase